MMNPSNILFLLGGLFEYLKESMGPMNMPVVHAVNPGKNLARSVFSKDHYGDQRSGGRQVFTPLPPLVPAVLTIEENLKYAPNLVDVPAPNDPLVDTPYGESAFFQADDGAQLVGELFLQENPQNARATFVYFFQSPLFPDEHRFEAARRISSDLGVNVFMVHYRGYGCSFELADVTALKLDEQAAFKYLKELASDVGTIYAYGRSTDEPSFECSSDLISDLPIVEQSNALELAGYQILQENPKLARATLVFFNDDRAGTLGHRFEHAKDVYLKFGVNIVMMDHRGYGGSVADVQPSEEQFTLDKQHFLLELQASEDVFDVSKIFLYEQSLGGSGENFLDEVESFLEEVSRISSKASKQTKFPSQSPRKSPSQCPQKSPSQGPQKSPSQGPHTTGDDDDDVVVGVDDSELADDIPINDDVVVGVDDDFFLPNGGRRIYSKSSKKSQASSKASKFSKNSRMGSKASKKTKFLSQSPSKSPSQSPQKSLSQGPQKSPSQSPQKSPSQGPLENRRGPHYIFP